MKEAKSLCRGKRWEAKASRVG